jgi:hypothetical protein
VSATTFIGTARWRRRQPPQRFFPPRGGQGLLEHFDLERLAAEQAFQLADTLFEFASAADRDNVLVGFHRHLASLDHQAPPVEQEAR